MEIEDLRQGLAAAPQTEKFSHWCVLELFGHNKIAGLVTEATIASGAFIRVDVPKPPAEGQSEETLYTRYFGPSAIYAINPTTKEEVMKIVTRLHPPAPTPRVSEQRALPGYRDEEDDDDYPEDYK